MRRFYTGVDTEPQAVGHLVRLDGKPVRTPAQQLLAMPTAELAGAVAEEWQAQAEEIAPKTMPLTRLATTAIDLMPARRDDAIAEAAEYAATDLLCYRAAQPAPLVARQNKAWQPWLDWAERQYGARLVSTAEVDPIPQPQAALQALRAAVALLDDWRLVGLHAATILTGSLVLGLAIEQAALAPEEAFATAMLDELYEIEQWGEESVQRQRHAALRHDLRAAVRYLQALNT
jgi:chaperone required for assembly of F1-ATPase